MAINLHKMMTVQNISLTTWHPFKSFSIDQIYELLHLIYKQKSEFNKCFLGADFILI